jgi:hypothetical protein
MVLLFRKYFVDAGHKDWMTKFNAYADTKAYLDMSDLVKRANAGTAFYK